jgi:hypothetical protein
VCEGEEWPCYFTRYTQLPRDFSLTASAFWVWMVLLAGYCILLCYTNAWGVSFWIVWYNILHYTITLLHLYFPLLSSTQPSAQLISINIIIHLLSSPSPKAHDS